MARLKFTVIAVIVLLVSGVSQVWAGGSSPNVVVYTGSGQPGGSYLTVFAPDGTSAGKLVAPDAASVNVSPSLQWYSVLTSGSNNKLSYAPLANFSPGALTEVKTEPGFDILGAVFNWDSSYLLYVQVNLGAPEYLIGIVELSTGKQVVYSRPYTRDKPTNLGAEFAGAASPMYLDAQSGRLVVNTFMPYTEAHSQGLYETNIGNFASIKSGRYPLPPLTQIASADQYNAFGGPQFLSPAPSGMRYLAYFSNNPDNPPANYQEAPFKSSYNTLSILDLNVGTSTVAAQAGKGQGLERLTWSPFNPAANPPGDKVYFTGGNYNNTSYISQPRLYTLQISTNTVSEGPVLTTNPNEEILGLLVCTNTTQDTLYFIGGSADGTTQTLYSAPLNDLSQKKTLVNGSFVGLMGCVPPLS